MERTQLPFGVRTHLFLDGEWLVGGLRDNRLFHRISLRGEEQAAFGSPEAALTSDGKAWAGDVQDEIALRGRLAPVGEQGFVFSYDAVPLVESYTVTGTHVWTTPMTGLAIPSQADLEARWQGIRARNPAMSVGQGMIFLVNAAIAVGPDIAVLHDASRSGRWMTLLSQSGVMIDTIPVLKHHTSVAWSNGRLLALGVLEASDLAVDEVDVSLLVRQSH